MALFGDNSKSDMTSERERQMARLKASEEQRARFRAEEEAKIAEENHVAMQHFPVYKTNAAEIDEEKMQALTHPLIWNFYSGKAVKAMLRFVQKNDAVNLFGASAKKAFEENF